MMAFTVSAAAQETSRFEVDVFGGAYIGTRISLTARAEERIGDAPAFGLRGAWALNPKFSLEASVMKARPKLRTLDPVSGVVRSAAPIDATAFELEALFNVGRGPIRGYFGLGVGVSTLDPLYVSGGAGSDTRFAFNVALGGKLILSDALALRLDSRYRWRITDERLGTVLCLEDGCQTYTTSFYSSAEVTAGLSYRFGGTLPDPVASSPADGNGTGDGARNFRAAAGGVVLAEFVPWAYSRYVAGEAFSRISTDSVHANFQNGFGFDRDSVATNQYAHPYHGSLFFNSARSNGYGYWESGLFALAGSFSWEMVMETAPPAMNDLVNTSLGGMVQGEIQHRLSRMILDETASGSERFWREAGAFVLNPMGGFNRLFKGEMTRNVPNPDDRFPGLFRLGGAAGIRYVTEAQHPVQGLLTVALGYGDPFAGEIRKPFDSFTVGADLTFPGGAVLSRAEARGVLKGWELGERTDRVRNIFEFFQLYEYLNNEAQVFGAQILGAGLLSRFQLEKEFSVTSEVSVGVFPLAAIETTNALSPITGRSYDYATGGSLRVGGALVHGDDEVVTAEYSVRLGRSLDGVGRDNTLRSFRAVGHLPLGRTLVVGGGFSWFDRHTIYKVLPQYQKSQTEVRVFFSWRLL